MSAVPFACAGIILEDIGLTRALIEQKLGICHPDKGKCFMSTIDKVVVSKTQMILYGKRANVSCF